MAVDQQQTQRVVRATVRSPVAMHLRWPNLTVNRDPRAPKSVDDQQKDIDKAHKTIRDAFDIARSYWHARKSGSTDYKSDLRWEAMIPARCRCCRSSASPISSARWNRAKPPRSS
jgi:hypothetical protein